MLHLNLSTLAALALSFIAAPAAQWIGAQRDKAIAAASHLSAQAAAIKNPVEREIAQTALSLAPVVMEAAAPTIESSINHVVTEVSKVSAPAGAMIGSLISAALSPAPSPIPNVPPAPTPAPTPATPAS